MMAQGKPEWHDSPPLAWDAEVHRFHAALEAFDAYLRSDQPLNLSAEKLFQGPIADALTHVGQLSMLRRIAGAAGARRELRQSGDLRRARWRGSGGALREFD